MKKILLILSLIICSLLGNATSIDDTTKTQTPNINTLKTPIIKTIFHAFENTNFDSLSFYSKNHIVLYIKIDSLIERNRVEQDKVIHMMNSIFSSIEYDEFKILSGISEDGEDIILVEVYVKNEDSGVFTLKIYFMLNKHEAISEIAIIY